MICKHCNGRLASTGANCMQFRVTDEGQNLPVIVLLKECLKWTVATWFSCLWSM